MVIATLSRGSAIDELESGGSADQTDDITQGNNTRVEVEGDDLPKVLD
jgi:hypothetical protein